jgi:hypothetical protein
MKFDCYKPESAIPAIPGTVYLFVTVSISSRNRYTVTRFGVLNNWLAFFSKTGRPAVAAYSPASGSMDNTCSTVDESGEIT